MWDKLIEVFACYGAVVLALYGCCYTDAIKRQGLQKRDEIFFSMVTGWSALTAVAGVIYILVA
ncbi:hypothetical protein [Tritonibacter mobilis]|uniref:hypothetical protein n=1 Tax=Tritonibacter mobilis TaxID=379347 RepID=UPI000806B505|nr:hypothetical protein [Tritonibacter mobilis]